MAVVKPSSLVESWPGSTCQTLCGVPGFSFSSTMELFDTAVAEKVCAPEGAVRVSAESSETPVGAEAVPVASSVGADRLGSMDTWFGELALKSAMGEMGVTAPAEPSWSGASSALVRAVSAAGGVGSGAAVRADTGEGSGVPAGKLSSVGVGAAGGPGTAGTVGSDKAAADIDPDPVTTGSETMGSTDGAGPVVPACAAVTLDPSAAEAPGPNQPRPLSVGIAPAGGGLSVEATHCLPVDPALSSRFLRAPRAVVPLPPVVNQLRPSRVSSRAWSRAVGWRRFIMRPRGTDALNLRLRQLKPLQDYARLRWW